LIRKNDTTFLVIATIKAKPNEVASLAQNADLDVFNLTDANTRPLALRLANRIEDVLRGKTVPTFSDTTDIVISTTPAIGTNQDEQLTTGKKLGSICNLSFFSWSK
jgi:hypothetical protein